MEEKISLVYEFFKQKLINGEYRVERVTEHHVTVSIIGYTFVIWTYNNSYGVSTYDGSFMSLKFSEDEKESAWRKLLPIVDHYRRSDLIAKKRAELAELEKQISFGS